jgi:putative ABC transport system permease protein
MLGVIIGVAAVIVMIGIGTGAQETIAQQIASIGSNLLIVIPGSTTSGGLRMGFGTKPSLTYDDALAIGEECDAVQYAAPILPGTIQVVYGNRNWSTLVSGVTPDYEEVRGWKPVKGRFFSRLELDGAVKVCLLGQTVVKKLFSEFDDPLGQIIRINRVPFRVIGILVHKGQSPLGRDQDDVILIPITTAMKRLFGQELPGIIRYIMVKTRSTNQLEEAAQQIRNLLRQRHRLNRSGQEDDFYIRNLSEMMVAAEQSARVMSLLLGAIASISLIVGGIGIMNIMLVSVTERTKEIGIRMAVGAREADILSQFLVEALVLSLTGGILGILLGIGGAYSIAKFLQWPILIRGSAILLAFFFAALVGIFFGLYPARKASKLQPIEALHYQ